MSRGFEIPGECLVQVKGNVDCSLINVLADLGLSEDAIRVSWSLKHKPINVNAWGNGEVPAEEQCFLSDMRVAMRLIHYDNDVLDRVLIEAAAGGVGSSTGVIGQLPHTGALMGNGVPRFASGNHYIGLNITSPINALPWRFMFARIDGDVGYPLGTDKSVVDVAFRVIPYTVDPYGSPLNPGGLNATGLGSSGYRLFDRTLDT